MARVIKYADEWLPHPDRGELPLSQRIAEFWELSEAAGRGRMPVSVYGAAADPARVAEYQAAGVSRCVFRLPAAGADAVLPALERAAAVAHQFS